jgi:hypothetical protein
MGQTADMYKILERKPDKKKYLGRPRHRWEKNIKLNFQEIEWEDMLHVA